MDYGKTLQRCANVAIIIVAILITATLIRNYTASRSPTRISIRPGDTFTLPNANLSGHRTLVFALSTKCHFCTESAPFYRVLLQQAVGVKFMALFPQETEETVAYLREVRVPIQEVRQVGMGSIHVTGTPTLILLDEDSRVLNVWKGKLPASDESAVITALTRDGKSNKEVIR